MKHGCLNYVWCAKKVGGTNESVKEHNRTQKTHPNWTCFVYSGGDGRIRKNRENTVIPTVFVGDQIW